MFVRGIERHLNNTINTKLLDVTDCEDVVLALTHVRQRFTCTQRKIYQSPACTYEADAHAC